MHFLSVNDNDYITETSLVHMGLKLYACENEIIIIETSEKI